MPRKNKNTYGEGEIPQKWQDRWRARVTVGYDDDLKRVRKTVYGKTKQECQEKLNELKTKYITGNSQNPTLAQWMNTWLKEKTNILDGTKREYGREIQKINDLIGSKLLKEIEARDIQGAINTIAVDSPRTAQKALTRLKTALDLAFHSGIISRNPAQIIELPKYAPKKYVIWHGEDISKFISECQGRWSYPLYRTALGAGLRPGELIALQWRDLEDGKLNIRRTVTLTVDGKETIHEATKTASGTRVIELAPDVDALLLAHRETLEQKHIYSQWIFCTQNGTIISRTNIRKSLHRICATYDLPKIRPHDLRHTFVSMAIRHMYTAPSSHWDLVKLSRYIGHSNPAFTLQRYAHEFQKYDDKGTVPSLEDMI